MESYDERLAQLKQIVEEIESGEMGVDRLTAQVTKATQLLKSLREQLVKVETDVNKVLETFDKAQQ